MPAYSYGGLYVIERAAPTDLVTRRLKEVDERLFLERQIGLDQRPVWCVVCDVGLDGPPVTLLEHRDDNGNPIPDPSEMLVYRVQRMERDGHRLHESVLAANRRMQEEKRQQTHADTVEIMLDMIPRTRDTRSAVLHRGVHLRRSRHR